MRPRRWGKVPPNEVRKKDWVSSKGSRKEVIYESSHTPLEKLLWEGRQKLPLSGQACREGTGQGATLCRQYLSTVINSTAAFFCKHFYCLWLFWVWLADVDRLLIKVQQVYTSSCAQLLVHFFSTQSKAGWWCDRGFKGSFKRSSHRV